MRRLHWVRAADGTQLALHFHEPTMLGLGTPPVLLTNGIGTTENFWRHLLADLTKDHRVAHWDYRAHGSTGPSVSGDYSLPTQARDLEKVTEDVLARTSGGPPIHIAFSMGVAVLFELYRKRPDLVRSMVLIGGSPDAPGSGRIPAPVMKGLRSGVARLTPFVPTLQPLIGAALTSRPVYAAGRALGVLQPRAPKDDIAFMMQGMARMNLQAWAQTLSGLLAANGSDVLPTVQVPVLIIAAAKDVLMPLAQMRRLRDALPRARYVEVADAGHAGMLEAGDEMAAEIRRFL